MSLDAVLQAWGLPALVAGGFIEGDAVAMIGGAMAHRGQFPFAAAVAAVSAGAALADQLWFHLARSGRERPVVRRVMSSAAARQVQSRIARNPALAVVAFRFLWGFRTVGPVALGVSGVSRRLFVPLNLISVAVWGFLMTSVGYGAGHAISRVFGHLPLLHHLGLVVVAGAAMAIILLLARRAMDRSSR